MGHFISEELTRIEMDDGEWIDIKAKLSVGDYERIAVDSNGVQPEARIISSLLCVIKAWNLKDDGKEMPITKENIRRLDQGVAVQILTEVGKHNQLLKKA